MPITALFDSSAVILYFNDALGARQDQELACLGRELEVPDSTRCQQQPLLANVQNPGYQSSGFQRAAEGAGLAQREGPVVQGTRVHGKEKKSFVERPSSLNRPLRTRMVDGVGAGG